MRKILLTQGKIALVDEEYFEKINKFKWYAWNYNKKNGFYALRNILINNKRSTISMHKEIMGSSNNLCIDHINGNGLDNRKSNLRFCTRQQNQFNRKYHNKNNKLKTKGIIWDKQRKKFRAEIKFNRKLIYLGRYNTLPEARQARKTAELKHFGEFAERNMI